ncbi:MAG TPA: MFS transporter, partial [Chthoniobacterales bacterium]|nr:MFS transporter [Chthoniobacterales bacterium]
MALPRARPLPNEQRTGGSRRWLNRSILGIGLASLFSDAGHEMATAAMPVLLASFGASSALLGLIEGVADGASSFAKLFSGLYSDRLQRRKPLAVTGYFVTASAMASFALATQWWHVLVGRTAGWIGRGARSPVRNVLLTEATTPATYGRAFGLERAMDSAGAIVGPALALAFLGLVGLRSIFLLTLIPGLMAALVIGFLVVEKPHAEPARATFWQSLHSLPNEFRRYLIGVSIAGIGDFSKALLILWATQAWSARFGVARAASLAMLFYIGYNVVYTISCYVSGMLADRFPKNRVLASGYAVAVIPAAALMFPGDSLGKFAIAFAGAGLYMGVWETLENSTAATMLPGAVRGLGFGVLATVNGIGDFVSSAAVGALWVISPVLAMAVVIVSSLGGAA